MAKATPPDTDEEAEIHRAVSNDGMEIAGRVHGTGPPLVLVPGALGDGETVWEQLLPLLTDQLTCYTLSTRGRGLSGESSDHLPERLVEDVTSFAESIGEPVRLMGWSSGALMALAAAENTDALSAVAAYEPPVFEIMSERVAGRMTDTITRMAAVAEEGRMADAARTWIEFVATDDEMAEADSVGLYEGMAPNVVVQLQGFDQLSETDWSSPTDPSELVKISVPCASASPVQPPPRTQAFPAATLT